jgi:hypothetical protein
MGDYQAQVHSGQMVLVLVREEGLTASGGGQRCSNESQQRWWRPRSFITKSTDNKGERFGNKTATLEMIGLLLTLLLIPEKLKNVHIRMFS